MGGRGYYRDDGRRDRRGLFRLRIVNRVTLQLSGQNGSDSSKGVVHWAAKLVSPIGLNHAVEGGTNCARLESRARSHNSVGVAWPTFSERGREAGKDLDPFVRSESSEEGVVGESNLSEKCSEPRPAAAALGAGSVGNCCVLGSSRSSLPTLEMKVGGKGRMRND